MLPISSRAARVTAAVSAGLATLALAGTAVARTAPSAGQRPAVSGFQARVVPAELAIRRWQVEDNAVEVGAQGVLSKPRLASRGRIHTR